MGRLFKVLAVVSGGLAPPPALDPAEEVRS